MIDPTNYDSTEAIKKSIIEARPRIEQVNRIAGWSMPILGTFYMILGLSMFNLNATLSGHITILNALFNYQFWGGVFFCGGILLWGGFLSNSWSTMRRTLAVMFAVMSVWGVALMVRLFFFGFSNVFILLLWSALGSLVFVIYLFFFPDVPASERRIQEEEHDAVAT